MMIIDARIGDDLQGQTDAEFWDLDVDDNIRPFWEEHDLPPPDWYDPSIKGGPGSGNFGHGGRPGSEGGSVAGGGRTASSFSGDVVEFDKSGSASGKLNGIDIAHQEPRDWANLPDTIFEPPMAKLPYGMKLSAGVVTVEEDGRLWVVEPSGHYGGYEHTFAKGRVEDGLTMQQTAMKEAYEEMGLNVRLTSYLRDAEGSTTVTRYYLAERIGGHPSDAHWETDKVKLATPERLKTMLNVSRDRQTLSQVAPAPKKAWKSLPFEDGENGERDRLEKVFENRIYRVFRQTLARIITLPSPTPERGLAIVEKATSDLRDALLEMFSTSMILGAEVGQEQIEYLQGTKKATDISTSWDLVHTDAINWARRYTDRTLTSLNVTSGRAVATAIEEWTTNGLPLPALERTLTGIFGRRRARLIATTEVTRAYARGSILAWKRSGVVVRNEWRTAEDEKVCPVCGPLANRTTNLDRYFKDPTTGKNTEIWTPPAHPGCRCWLVPIVPGIITEPEVPPPPLPSTEDILDQLDQMLDPSLLNAPEWPDDPQDVEYVRGLGGSTGAELVRDPRTGTLFVRKYGASVDHLLEEYMADEMYRVAGFDVPESRLYSKAGPHNTLTKLSKFIEGTSLGDLKNLPDQTRYLAARAKLRDGFVMDAYLGNWDVIGMSSDNVLVDASNRVWRIDNGGALRYRAQGSMKTGGYSDFITELWTMRDKTFNQSAANIFDTLDFERDIIPQMRVLVRDMPNIRNIPWTIDAGPTSIKQMQDLLGGLLGRSDHLESLIETFDIFKADQWNRDYIDTFLKHSSMMAEAKVFEPMSQKLSIGPRRSYRLVDEKGDNFDNLRGTGSTPPVSVSDRFGEYLGREKSKALQSWAEGQAGSSWSPGAISGKYAIYRSREIPFAEYYWGKRSEAEVQKIFRDYLSGNGFTEKTFIDAIAAEHALTYQIFTTMEIPNIDRVRGVIRKALRTESLDVMQRYGFPSSPDGVRRQILRGAAESGSLVQPYSYRGDLLTVQEVPITRVIGSYLNSLPGMTAGLFAGDNENEILVIFEGLLADYVGQYGKVTVTIQ